MLKNEFLSDKRDRNKNVLGVGLVEYALLLALIAVVGVPVVQNIGKNINNTVRTVIGSGTFHYLDEDVVHERVNETGDYP